MLCVIDVCHNRIRLMYASNMFINYTARPLIPVHNQFCIQIKFFRSRPTLLTNIVQQECA